MPVLIESNATDAPDSHDFGFCTVRVERAEVPRIRLSTGEWLPL